MQISNDYLLLAKDASIDTKDNMVSIFKIMETMTFTFKKEEFKKVFNAEPGESAIAMPAEYAIVSAWRAPMILEKDFAFEVKTVLRGPDQKVLMEKTQAVIIQKSKDRIRLTISVRGLPVGKPGGYTYSQEATKNGKLLDSRSYTLNVKLNVDKD